MLNYDECAGCGFFNSVKEKRCLNCGRSRTFGSAFLHRHPVRLEKPKPISGATRGVLLFTAVILEMIFFVEFIMLPNKGTGGECGGFFLAVFACLATIFLMANGFEEYERSQLENYEREKRELENPKPIKSPENTLKHFEEKIDKRLSKLKDRGKKLAATRECAEQNAGDEWRLIVERLQAAQDILREQTGRFHAKLLEIELVRAQNKLVPFAVNFENLTFEEIERGLQMVEKAEEDLKYLLPRLDNANAKTPSEALEVFRKRLADSALSCEKLRQALSRQQAVAALRGIAPLDDMLADSIESLRRIAREVETFQAQIAMTNFSASFDELEIEYKRLKDDNETAQKINRLLSE